MNGLVAMICAVVITSLLGAMSPAHAIDIAGIQYVDLSHYPEENLHNEATFSSRNNGIVVIAYADIKSAERFCHLAGPQVRTGAQIRSVMRAAPQSGKTFDIYYNGASYVRANKMVYPATDSFTQVLEPIVQLQSVDLRMAAKAKEIADLEKKVKAIGRALELGDDPDIND